MKRFFIVFSIAIIVAAVFLSTGIPLDLGWLNLIGGVAAVVAFLTGCITLVLFTYAFIRWLLRKTGWDKRVV